jgi:adenine/guanine phosphoribosyltransferase-like PRPP-binding protein
VRVLVPRQDAVRADLENLRDHQAQGWSEVVRGFLGQSIWVRSALDSAGGQRKRERLETLIDDACLRMARHEGLAEAECVRILLGDSSAGTRNVAVADRRGMVRQLRRERSIKPWSKAAYPLVEHDLMAKAANFVIQAMDDYERQRSDSSDGGVPVGKRFERLSWTRIEDLVDTLVAHLIALDLDRGSTVLVGVSRGGTVVGTLLSHALGLRPLGAVIAWKYLPPSAQETSEEGQVQIEGVALPHGRYRTVIIVDEVIDHGTTLNAVADVIDQKCLSGRQASPDFVFVALHCTARVRHLFDNQRRPQHLIVGGQGDPGVIYGYPWERRLAVGTGGQCCLATDESAAD